LMIEPLFHTKSTMNPAPLESTQNKPPLLTNSQKNN
jgi:hypothetical protein